MNMQATWRHIICGMLLPGPFLWADDVPDVQINPASVRVNYEGERTHAATIHPGTEVGVRVSVSNGIEIQSVMESRNFMWGEKESMLEHNSLLLKDSTVKNLGAYLGCREKEGVYYFAFERPVSKGVEYLQLTGYVSMDLKMREEKTDMMELSVQEGREIEIGEYRVIVVDVSEREPIEDLLFQNDDDSDDGYQYKIGFLIQWNPKGKIREEPGLEVLGTNDERISYREGKFYRENIDRTKIRNAPTRGTSTGTVYLFTQLPEQLRFVVKHRPVQKMEVPVDIKFDLYPSDPEEANPNGN